MERGHEHSYNKGRAMVGYQHYTAETLELERWGEYELKIIQDNNCKYIICKEKYYKTKLLSDVYLYDNGNILIKFVVQQSITSPLYELLCNSMMSSQAYDDISTEVYDNEYRIAKSSNGITILREKDGRAIYNRDKNWKDIKGIYDGYAIVNSKDNYYNLVRLNLNNAYSNLLQGAYDISYIKDGLFKYRDPESGGLYLPYNARENKKIKNPKISYHDILKISDQLVMGVKHKIQWDLINIHTLQVVYSCLEEPKQKEDTIEIVCVDKKGNDVQYTINTSGTNLSEEPEGSTEEPVAEVRGKDLPQAESVSLNEPLATQDENIEIGKIIVVTNESVKKSEHGEYLHFNNSFRKACDCVGYPCWILLKQKLIVITERKGRGGRTDALNIIKKGTLPSDFEQFSNISQDNKLLYFEKSLISSKTEIINKAINIISPELKNLAEDHKESIEAQQKRDIEDTKDILRLKAIYDFLKLQGFEKFSICNAITALFPEIEEYIDFTNVKQNYYYGWKRYVENVAKLKRIMPDGYVFDDSKVVKELKFTDNEKIMLDYYTKVKGYQLDIAMEFIEEESPSGGELRKEYETLMRLDDIVENQRIMLQREIIGDLVNNFTAMVDTSEMLRLPGASNTMIDNSGPVSIAPKSTDFKIKEEKHIFKINESIKYDMFERKRFHYYEKPVYYLAYEKHIVILLNSEKARELDADNSRQFKIRGNGDDKKFDQDYSAINGTIANQRENNTRIYVFECIDNETCRFFDEFQCIKSERIKDEKEERKIIYFTMKSLIRYNTEK